MKLFPVRLIQFCLLALLPCAVVAAPPGVPSAASPTATAPAAQDSSAPDLERIGRDLQETQKAFEAAKTPEGVAENPEVPLLLRRADGLTRQLTEWPRRLELQKQLVATEELARSWKGLEEKAPYAVRFLDRLRSEKRTLELQLYASKRSADLLNSMRLQLQASLLDLDKQSRRALEAVESATDPAKRTEESGAAQLAELEGRAALAQFQWAEAKLGNFDLEIRLGETALQLARRKVEAATKLTEFRQVELTEILAALDAEQEKLGREALQAEQEVQKLEQAASAGTKRNPAQGERLRTAGIKADVLRALRTILPVEKEVWSSRFVSWNEFNSLKLPEWRRKLKDGLSVMETVQDLLQMRLQADRIPDDAWQVNPNSELLANYAARQQLLVWCESRTDRFKTLLENWRLDLDARQEERTLSERAADARITLLERIRGIWGYELFSVGDTFYVEGRPVQGRRGITLGKVVLALAVAIAIWLLARWLGSRIRRLATTRFGVTPAAAGMLRNLIVAGISITGLVAAMNLVRIPLTVFTFLGGAIAIGVGFGAQNLVSNFISGLILAFERPIRTGDQIEIEGSRGTVSTIGLRASIVRRLDGAELLVPNKEFLEKTVVNLTHSDSLLRQCVRVGVEYGSPVRQVRELLLKIAEEHGRIAKKPAPVTVFEDFGPNALQFSLYFWMDIVRDAGGGDIGSDIRSMIEESFRENGIALATPPRTLRFDPENPVVLKMLPPDPPANS